jgi:type IV secretion system protein TrbI
MVRKDRTEYSAEGKVEPASLELRARPRPVRRLNRLAIVMGAMLIALILFTATIIALHPPQLFTRSNMGDLYNTDRKQTADGLSKLPKDYAGLPKEPLRATPATLNVARPNIVQPAQDSPRPQDDEAEKEERQRQLRLAIQARESGVLFKLSQPLDKQMLHSLKAGNSPSAAEATFRPVRVHADAPYTDPNNQTGDTNSAGMDGGIGASASQWHKIAFMNAQSPQGERNTHSLELPPSPYTLLAGTVISASLITGLSSDLPGETIAQVTENVFDSVSGHHLLVPQGSRLIGQYDSVIAFGQKRALLVWTRLIMPNGSSVRIDNLPATDRSGYAGLQDGVDYHSYQLLKGIGLATVLGVATQLSLGGNGQTDLIKALRQSVQQSSEQAGQKLVERELDVQPTLTIRPGFPLRVLVAKDLVLAPYRDAAAASWPKY